MPYTYDWKVRFGDADPFRIAHYPRIIDAIHEVSDRFMDDIGYPYWRYDDEHGFGLPIIEVNAEFSTPLHAGDVVTIALTPSLGTRSVRFDYEGTLEDGTTAFTAFEQRACVPIDGENAMELPEGVRTAMEPFTDEDA